MLAPTTAVRSGLYAIEAHGLGLGAADAQALLADRDAALTLAQAIRDGVARARTQGLSGFAPDSTTLQVPGAVPLGELRGLFAFVIGRPYQAGDERLADGLPDHGAMTLAQWSEAETMLATHAAQEGSKLSNANGGGPQYARGRWFVNGEPYSVAELFLTVRMGSVAELDRELAKNLNTLVTNTNLARDLMEVLAEMKRRRFYRESELHEPDVAPTYDGQRQYLIDDRVSYEGKVYRATGVNTGGSYDPANLYSVGDVVYFQGQVYQLIAGESEYDFVYANGQIPTNTDYWNSPPAYSGDERYIKNDVVLFEGQYYKLIKNDKKPLFGENYTQGKEPTNTEFWSGPLSVDAGNSALSNALPTDTRYWAVVEPKIVPAYPATNDFTAFVQSAGLTVPQLMELGLRFKGADSVLNRVGQTASNRPPGVISATDYQDAMAEIQALFDSINSDNDVKKLRVDTLHNERLSTLTGMSAFLSSQMQQSKTVERNL